MESLGKGQQSLRRNEYRTTSRVQLDQRRLLLRGGKYDGRTWVGVVGVGQRVFCGNEDKFSLAGMYLVTDQVEDAGPDGPANIAVPVIAS